MTNTDRAAEIIEDHLARWEVTHYEPNSDYLAQALTDAGLLAPDLTIIRTVDELEALGAEAVVQRLPQHPGQYSRTETACDLAYIVQRWGTNKHLPAVVITPAAQVRAARKALEEAE